MTNKLIIDFHHHLLQEENYAEKLIEKMDEAGIGITCLSGLGIGKGKEQENNYDKFNLGSLSPDNTDVLKVMKKYPDRFIGLGVINLGRDNSEKVHKLHKLGFRGLKVTRPLNNYDADEYLPIYREAEELGMPILFHTGLILVTPYDGEDDVSSERMRPILIDRVARKFPKLKIVLAHLGVPWFEETATLARFHDNIYVDITGSSFGWRNRMCPNDFQKLFYWENAFDKIIFGTDVHADQINEAYQDHKRICNLLNLSKETQTRIFNGNAAELLGLRVKEERG